MRFSTDGLEGESKLNERIARQLAQTTAQTTLPTISGDHTRTCVLPFTLLFADNS